MKEQSKSVSRTVIEEVRYLEHPCGVAAYEITTTDGKRKPQVVKGDFVAVADLKSRTPLGFRRAVKEQWIYISKSQLRHFLKVMGNGSDEFFSVWNEFVDANSPMEQIKKRGFDSSYLYIMDRNSYLIYRWGEDIPVSCPYRINYIGGIVNDEYDLDVAFKILSDHPWVSDVEKVEIPYYNAEKGHTHSVEYTVHLPQKEYDKIARFWRDEKKSEYWSCRVGDSFVYMDYEDGVIDILGLKPAWKGSRYAEEE